MISSIKIKEKQNDQKKKIKNKKKGWTLKDEEEENQLSSYFFGSSNTANNNDEDDEEALSPPSWSYNNDHGDDNDEDEEDYTNSYVIENEERKKKKNKYQEETSMITSVWQDDDDDDDDSNNNTIIKEVNMLKQSKRKKLRHSINETNISIQEYENRLRTRYNHTQSSSFINTDWANTTTSTTKDNKDQVIDDIFSNTESIFKTTTNVSDDDDNDNNALSTRTNNSVIPLPPNQIKTIRHPDVNREYYTNNKKTTTIQVVQFYRGGNNSGSEQNPLVFTAGLDCMLNFYRIYSSPASTSTYNSNNENEKKVESNKLSGYFFQNFPIRKASFLYNDANTNNPKVVLSSRRSYLNIYDAISGTIDTVPKISSRSEKSYENMLTSPNGQYIAIIGNDGYVLLLSTQTKRLVQTFKINGNARSITFHPNNDMLFVSGSDGIIYRFDLRSNKKCLDFFDNNKDCTTIHSLSCYYQPDKYNNNSDDNLKLAVGSESGIVNIYTLPKNNKPTCTKTIMNLKTSITHIKPNHTNSSILGLGTSFSRDGLRLLHLQSNTIFSNWPTRNTPLSYVFDFDFSYDNKYLCIGNDKGRCLLYELLHFSS